MTYNANKILTLICAALCLTSCAGLLEDEADAFVGTYSVSAYKTMYWGGDYGSLAKSGTLVISKISSERVEASGFFSASGNVVGGSVYFESSSEYYTNGEYINTSYSAATLSGNLLSVTITDTGQAMYNGRLYPFNNTTRISARRME